MFEKPKKKQAKGAEVPLWMATFADMMSLMMCFFVLLFAQAKMDEAKYESVIGSLRQAFGGVQFITPRDESQKGLEAGIVSGTGHNSMPTQQVRTVEKVVSTTAGEDLYKKLKEGLKEDIEAGRVILERNRDQVIVRFPEHVSFPSGSARLVSGATELIRRVVGLIDAESQQVTVAGHTDNIPLRGGGGFSSNWDLSAARAVSVAERVLEVGSIRDSQLIVSGFGSSRPLVDNSTREQRARNRRVEIIVAYRQDMLSEDGGLPVLESTDINAELEVETAPADDPEANGLWDALAREEQPGH
ncbi:MAG: flagellar motor protein MotB [Abyssibacter sp.]|uniref:flagellar motor protein MotB n=1 Tax=Abyssibacter sp. TaxID=2320200 RepID=UPI002E989CA4|nr:flagellar motor protein MotB [Pseudomonadota bacterium]